MVIGTKIGPIDPSLVTNWRGQLLSRGRFPCRLHATWVQPF